MTVTDERLFPTGKVCPGCTKPGVCEISGWVMHPGAVGYCRFCYATYPESKS